MKKVCSKCGEKDISEFFKEKTHKDGYNGVCKDCTNARELARRRTIEGKLKTIYTNQVEHSYDRSYEMPVYTQKEFVSKYKDNEEYLKLYKLWVKSDYDRNKAPSFDRQDNLKGYSFDNLRCWCTWKENHDRDTTGKKENDVANSGSTNQNKTVDQLNGTTKGFIKQFHSTMEAERQTNIRHSSISQACRNGCRAGGFYWKYV